MSRWGRRWSPGRKPKGHKLGDCVKCGVPLPNSGHPILSFLGTPCNSSHASVRSQDPSQRRVLDRAARQRRINRQLEALENDNFQDDPHAGLPQLGKRLPQFDDDADTGEARRNGGVRLVGKARENARAGPGLGG